MKIRISSFSFFNVYLFLSHTPYGSKYLLRRGRKPSKNHPHFAPSEGRCLDAILDPWWDMHLDFLCFSMVFKGFE